jgi:hypothetical protein
VNREAVTTTIQKLDQSTTQASSIPKVIVRAEPTLARILKTLDADYVKVQVRLMQLTIFSAYKGKFVYSIMPSFLSSVLACPYPNSF